MRLFCRVILLIDQFDCVLYVAALKLDSKLSPYMMSSRIVLRVPSLCNSLIQWLMLVVFPEKVWLFKDIGVKIHVRQLNKQSSD